MDCDNQQTKFDNGLHQGNDNEEESDSDNIPAENFSEAIEKMNGSPSESCKTGAKPRGDDDDDDEGQTSEKPAASGIHKCEFCDRTFSSGKALGGHKRSHLQTLRKEAEPNNNNRKANCNDGRQICALCNKDFPSKKSLYGHMRKHSDDREWRGIHPPALPSNKQCSSSSVEDKEDEVVAASNKPVTNVSKYLQPSWDKTDKRSRQRICCSSKVVKAAQILMQMSRDVWPRGNLNGDGSGSSFPEFGDEGVSANIIDNEKEKEEEAEALPSASSGVQDRDEKAVTVKKSNNKRAKIVVKLKNPYYSASKDDYQRGFCGKSFSTSQALGGHILSHNKEKNNNRPQYETGESCQSDSRTIPDIDLNEPPNDVPDETN